MLDNIHEFKNFDDFKENLIEKLLEREPGIDFNPFECINPEDYIDYPLLEIPLNKIDNMPESASATKHGLEELAKEGHEPEIGAFHGVRLGKRVKIPVAVKTNENGTYSIIDGYHRAVQAFINGDKTITAFVEGGKGKTLKDIFDLEKNGIKRT